MSTLKVTNIQATGETASRAVSGVAAAWLQFNQTTPAITGSLNISSVSDDSTGIYSPSLTNAVNNTSDYVITGMSHHKSGALEPRIMALRYDQSGSFTTSSHTLGIYNGGNVSATYDQLYNLSVVYGDLA